MYHVNFGTGAGDYDSDLDLDALMAQVGDEVTYTQCSVTITDAKDKEVAYLPWYDVAPEEGDVVTNQFGDFGFYGEWAIYARPDISAAAAALGALGGKSTSAAKVSASRNNGKLGGRPSYNMQAMREIEAECNRFLSGAHCTADAGHAEKAGAINDPYAEEHIRIIDQIIAKYAVTKEVVATLPNGIKTYRLTDARGLLVAEYHDI